MACKNREKWSIGGSIGIRTLETVPRLHTFQACAFDHSATDPLRVFSLQRQAGARGGDLVLLRIWGDFW